VNELAWIVLAMLFSGLLIALATGGWTGTNGALDWFRAKFKGQPAA
jgi:hypothetical protein